MSRLGGLRVLLNPGIYAGMLVTALLVVAAYQVRPDYGIAFGGETDGPLLRGFNAGEQTPGDNPVKFRWSTGDASITLQDIGRQDLNGVLTVSGARPPGQPPPQIELSVGGKVLLKAQPPPEFKEYTFAVPREALENGTLVLHLTSNTFSPPGDPRQLGVIVTHLKLAPASNPDRFIEPPLGPLVTITGAAGLLGLVIAILGWGLGGAGLGGGLVGLLAAWLLVGDRLWLTTARWYQAWPQSLAVATIVVIAVWAIGGWLLRLGNARWTALQRRLLLTLMLLVFAVRLAGQLHPQIFIVDLIFHAHRFETVQTGQLLFTIESAEWGGRSTFYLPTPYIFMLPLNWLLNNELLVIKLFTVGLSTLGAFAVFYLIKRGLGDGRAGLIASTLYLTVPMAVLPFSWGITSNVFGEFFALCALAVAVTSYPKLTPARPAFWVLLFCLLMALLSHPGVVQLTLVAFGFISLLWLASRRIMPERRRAAWTLVALLVGFGLAYLLYYGHFAADMLNTLRQLQADRAAQAKPGVLHLKIGGSVADRSLGLIVRTVDTRREWFFGGLRGFWQEAQAYYSVWPLAGAAFGYALIWPVRGMKQGNRASIALAAVGWFLAVLMFAIVGWVMNLYVRYALFALPVIAIGAGLLLSSLWRKGRLGMLLTLIMLTFFAAEALALWQYRITYAFK